MQLNVTKTLDQYESICIGLYRQFVHLQLTGRIRLVNFLSTKRINVLERYINTCWYVYRTIFQQLLLYKIGFSIMDASNLICKHRQAQIPSFTPPPHMHSTLAFNNNSNIDMCLLHFVEFLMNCMCNASFGFTCST